MTNESIKFLYIVIYLKKLNEKLIFFSVIWQFDVLYKIQVVARSNGYDLLREFSHLRCRMGTNVCATC